MRGPLLYESDINRFATIKNAHRDTVDSRSTRLTVDELPVPSFAAQSSPIESQGSPWPCVA
jgi:hypothetical protein